MRGGCSGAQVERRAAKDDGMRADSAAQSWAIASELVSMAMTGIMRCLFDRDVY